MTCSLLRTSSGVPSARRWPSSSTTTRSESDNASPTLCSTSRTVRPRWCTPLMSSASGRKPSTPMPAAGSSRRSKEGSLVLSSAPVPPCEAKTAARVKDCLFRGSDLDVLAHCHRAKGARHLEGTPDACVAHVRRPASLHFAVLEADRAGRWPDGTGDRVEQRGLARAIRPDDRHDLAIRDVEADGG